jgi:CMP-N,N'-diacetyllegionaminic acid synthase
MVDRALGGKADRTNGANRVIALITARGGSKGLPRKNVLPAAGLPLIGWTIRAAQQAQVIDRLVLSSDDDEIMDAARQLGCDVPFRRPAALASDTATSMDVIIHALDQLPGYDYLVLLQPTSPLRTGADIDAAFALLQAHAAPCCVSVCAAEQSPYLMYRLGEDGRLGSLLPPLTGSLRRQDLPPVYLLNGAVYIARTDWLRQTRSFLGECTVAYRMPAGRSIDIDTADDFERFRRMVEGPAAPNR